MHGHHMQPPFPPSTCLFAPYSYISPLNDFSDTFLFLLFLSEVKERVARNEDVSLLGSWCEETRAGAAIIGAVY